MAPTDYLGLGVGFGAYSEVIPIYQPADLSPAPLKIQNGRRDELPQLWTGSVAGAVLGRCCPGVYEAAVARIR